MDAELFSSKGLSISADATLMTVEDVSASVRGCLFAVLMTASVWALTREEPTGRSLLVRDPVNPLFIFLGREGELAQSTIQYI